MHTYIRTSMHTPASFSRAYTHNITYITYIQAHFRTHTIIYTLLSDLAIYSDISHHPTASLIPNSSRITPV